MGDIVTFGVSLSVGAICLVAAAIFKWAPYFSEWKWPNYAILPLLLSGVAGLMTATVAGINIGGLISDGLQQAYSALNGIAPGLAWILSVGAAALVVWFAGGHMLAGEPDKAGAWQTAAVPFLVALIPAPIGPFLIAVLGFVVTVPTLVLSKLMGM